jgi:hypothetical protein
MDGKVWKNLRRPNGKLFFQMDNKGKLHLGVTIGLDWYLLSFSI